MHHLLKRQLKKTGATVDEKFLELVNQAYRDADEDRNLLEHSLDISSQEMRELYEQLQKTTQDKLQQSRQRYAHMTFALKDYYFFYTRNVAGTFTYTSDSVHNILGYKVEEFLIHYSTYLTDDPINQEIKNFTKRALEGKQQKPYEISVYHKNNSISYLEISEFPVFNAAGEVVEIEGVARDITSQHLVQQELDYLVQHDTLTGILNRFSLHNKLDFIIANSKRNKENFAILFLDLDHFKEINDTLGHDVGDLLLKESVARVQMLIRENDIFARIGGDEFVLVLTNIDRNYISKIAAKVVSSLKAPFLINKDIIKISTSVGIAVFPEDGSNIDTLLKNADQAMYNTKSTGRDNFSYYSLTHA